MGKRARGDGEHGNLPGALQQRRNRRTNTSFEEFIDVDGLKTAVEELKRRSDEPDTEVTAQQRLEAKYLLKYAEEYTKLTLLSSHASLSGRIPRVGQGGVEVWGRLFTYHSRQGAGRRYTTIERLGRGLQRGQYGSQRDGTNKWRAYGQQGCPKALRSRFVGRFCHDVDIKNCHPVIAVQLPSKLTLPASYGCVELPHFADYAEHRDRWIDDIATLHEIAEHTEGQRKELVKNLFVRLMYGGQYEAWSRTKLKRPLQHRHSGVDHVCDELVKLREAVFASEEWGGFAAAELERQAAKGKDSEACKRSTFSVILQTIEDDILQVIVNAFQDLGWKTTTLIYDGMHVLDDPSLELTDALRHAERRVRAVTGYNIELTEKPLFGLHERPIELTRA